MFTRLCIIACSGLSVAATKLSQEFEELIAAPPEPTAVAFSAEDYSAFDRSFEMRNAECTVGLDDENICFRQAPLEDDVVVGEVWPEHVPVIPVSLPVLMELEPKKPALNIYRVGRTIFLVDNDSEIVLDVLRLDESAPDAWTTRVASASGLRDATSPVEVVSAPSLSVVVND